LIQQKLNAHPSDLFWVTMCHMVTATPTEGQRAPLAWPWKNAFNYRT